RVSIVPSNQAWQRSGAPRFFAIAALVVLGGCSKAAPPSKPLRVAAAADLKGAFGEIGDAFRTMTGTDVKSSFGSTGLLAKQIQEGGPFDVFAAANVSFVEDVVQAGACDGATKAMYARGRIVLWTSKKSPVAPPSTLADLKDARFVKVAIANPEHAPYGRA